MHTKNKIQLVGIPSVLLAAMAIASCSSSSNPKSASSDTIRLANDSESANTVADNETSNLSVYLDDYASPAMTWADCGGSQLPVAEDGQYSVNVIFTVVDEACAPLESTFDIELHSFDLFAEDYTSNSTMTNKWLNVELNENNAVLLQFSEDDLAKTSGESGVEDTVGYFLDVAVNTENDEQKLCIIDFSTAHSSANTEAIHTVFLSKSTDGTCQTQTYVDDVDDVEDVETGECLSETEDGPCINTDIIEPQDSDLVENEHGKEDIQVCTLNLAGEVTCAVVTFDLEGVAPDASPSCFGPGYIEALEANEDETPYILDPEECN